jgi:predicted hydrolase (HD superfamily)
MRYCARKWGEDEEKWGIIGLIHDLDYETIIMGMRDVAEEIGLKGG